MLEEALSTAVLTANPAHSMAEYERLGGGRALRRVEEMDPYEVIHILRESGLRGRGGAGFPTASKWEGILRSDAERKFVVANGAEGEPGTFKDRFLLRTNPYQLVEGLLIALETIGAERGFIGVKSSFAPELEGVGQALLDFRSRTEAAGRIEIVPGPDEYLFGEEKALLEVIEGGLPLPRVFPPYIHGLYAGAYGGAEVNPTAVNNVETLSHVPQIIDKGPQWFRSLGYSADTPGTMVFTVLGDVRRPLVRELPLGLSLRQVLEDIAGGPRPGRHIKAVFPGLANAVITPDKLDTSLGFDSMRAAGASLGSAGFVVYDDSKCLVQVAYLFARFLHVESCNQCPPCKLGSRQIMEALDSLLSGTGSHADIETMREATGMVENNARCYLPTSTRLVISSILDAYLEDFQRHLAPESCPLSHDIELPKIVNYRPEDGFSLDQLYSKKQPDWSYAL